PLQTFSPLCTFLLGKLHMHWPEEIQGILCSNIKRAQGDGKDQGNDGHPNVAWVHTESRPRQAGRGTCARADQPQRDCDQEDDHARNGREPTSSPNWTSHL